METQFGLCETCQKKLGVWGIPGTFPTTKILLWIDKNLDPNNNMGWNASKVNEMYEWYIKGIESGLAPYQSPNHLQIGSFVLEHSGYSKQLVFGFVQALNELAQSGEINKRWWTGDGVNAGAKPSFPNFKDAIEQGGNALKTTITLLKWTAGITLAGGLVYFTWPMLSQARKKISKK